MNWLKNLSAEHIGNPKDHSMVKYLKLIKVLANDKRETSLTPPETSIGHYWGCAA